MARDPRPHFVLPASVTSTSPYQTPNQGGRPYATPPQERASHAALLRNGLATVGDALESVGAVQREAGWEGGFGLAVLFSSFPDVQLAIESLEQRSAGIELLSVRETENGTLASVWMPEGSLPIFERKIAAYLAEAYQDNQKLLDAIRDIRVALLEDLWTDQAPLPAENEVHRFEAWIAAPTAARRAQHHVSEDSLDARISRFRRAAEAVGVSVGTEVLRFPERAVVQVRGTLTQLRASSHLLGQLAELRFAPEAADFFMRLRPSEQREWGAELLERTEFPPIGADVPYVCILDTGVTQGHPLLEPALSAGDMHTVNVSWGAFDDHGHGTEQSGLALWGDLSAPLSGSGRITIQHRLESVKLQAQDGSHADEHLGPITLQAVSYPEIAAPSRLRVFSMALTSTRTTLRGRPTAWSAAVDALTSDWVDNGDQARLMILSGGNVDHENSAEYFSRNTTTSIEDPAQAWNALTVGAITHKVAITESDMHAYSPIASSGGLSPYSSCSVTWQRDAPFKPDVVFEGGNLAADGSFVSRADSLSLLTTNFRPQDRLLSTSEATSAATAVASKFAAEILSRYPTLWPQTVRALIVHSADWTSELLRQFPGSSRDDVEHRLRHCGWGEPNLERALHSGSDSLTLIVQSALQPFERRPARTVNGRRRAASVGTRDMQFHKIPWPKVALQSLLAMEVELRVTLSYFVEPNPGERGRNTRFTYASHGLRFAIQRPVETLDQFARRVNRLARDDEEGLSSYGTASSRWLLGSRRRFRGSLHHDRLRCSAVELAAREHVAVYPVGGWWKSREAQMRFDSLARYGLMVSVHAPEAPLEVDLYVETAQALAQVPIAIDV